LGELLTTELGVPVAIERVEEGQPCPRFRCSKAPAG